MIAQATSNSALGSMLNDSSTVTDYQQQLDQMEDDKDFVEQLQEQTEGSGEASNQDDVLMEKAKEMEGVFLNMLTQQMRKTVPDTEFMSGGKAEKQFNEMLYEEYANHMAQNQSFGLAEQIYNQLGGN